MYKDLLQLKHCSVSPEASFPQLNKFPDIFSLTNLYPSAPLSLDSILRQIKTKKHFG